MYAKYRRSKRISDLRPLWPLSLLLAGVFLFGSIFFATPAHAVGARLEFEQPKTDLVEQNDQKLKELEDSFNTEQEKLEAKEEVVQTIKQEAEQIAQTTEELKAEVSDIKEEIKVLEAKVAEKKRLEAERTVPQSRYADDSAGNTYAAGNCTYYVKQKRPDLSNGLGNANTWYERAKLMGYKTGTMAKKGAVGTTTRGWLGHVVYVEKWLGNGRILISEMNVNGLWSMQTREADESEFVYIYEL